MKMSMRMETKKVSRWISKVHRHQIPFSASQALNDSACQARVNAMNALAKLLDRPLPLFWDFSVKIEIQSLTRMR